MSQLATYIIGIILFSMIIIGSTSFLAGFNQNYNIEVEPGWEDTYNFIDNMTDIGVDTTEILESKDTNWVLSGLRMGYSVLKGTFQLPKFMAETLGNMGTRLHLPPWVTNHVVVIITIIIIFIIVAALVRWYI